MPYLLRVLQVVGNSQGMAYLCSVSQTVKCSLIMA